MLDPKSLRPSQEQYEAFTTRIGRKTRKRIQYDYRDTNGELFSCIGETLEDCRGRRDKWLQRST